MKKLVLIALSCLTAGLVLAQADPSTISNQVSGTVSVITLTNGVKYLYLPDGSWVGVAALGTNTGTIATVALTATTGTITTGVLTTLRVSGTETATNVTVTGAFLVNGVNATAGITNLTLNGWAATIITNRLTLIKALVTNDFFGVVRP